MNTTQVAQYITSRPFLLQIAKDEIWEKTWNIDLSKAIPRKEDIKQYLDKPPYKNVAIEALFKSNDGVCILGLIFNNHLLTTNVEDFLNIFVRESLNFTNFENFIRNLDKSYVGRKYLLNGEPDLIRIGVVNHWFSVGPCLIWKKGEAKDISQDILSEKLLKHPNVAETKLNYQGMSFVFNINESKPGLCHWIKSPCSRYNNGLWTLNCNMVIKYLTEWQGFELK